MTVTRLPLTAQRHFNNYLSGALPLCVVLGNGYDGWFAEHYIELHAYRIADDNDRIWIDFNDTFQYHQVLSTEVISVDEAEGIGSIEEYLVATIRDGGYVTLFLDLGVIRDLDTPWIHELLFFGFDSVKETFLAMGFGPDRRFGEFELSFSLVSAATRSGITQIRETERWGRMTAIAQVLRPATDRRSADAGVITRAIQRYVESTPPKGFDPPAGFWWYSRPAMMADDAPIRFGLDTYDEVISHIALATDGHIQLDYRLFHILAEQKQMLWTRLSIVQTAAGVAEEPLVNAYADVVRTAERLRLTTLKHDVARRSGAPSGHAEQYSALKAAEGSILEAFMQRYS